MIHVFLVEGPLGGEQFGIAAKHVPDLVYVARTPDGIAGPIADEWMIVGTDTSPPFHPFEGQVTYGLDRTASLLSPHEVHRDMEQGIAIYAWVDPES